MRDKHGFSLIELIIVIAIMAVVTSVIGLSFSMVSNQKAKSASKNVYNMLGTAQTVGMSKGHCYFVILSDTDENITVGILYAGKDGNTYSMIEEKDISKGVEVSFEIDGTTYFVGNPSSHGAESSSYKRGVIIEIDRTTGAFKATYGYTGDYAASITAANKLNACTDIYIRQRSGLYDIVLTETGKYYYK